MTIVKNERDELIFTRTVVRWRMCVDYRRLNQAIGKIIFPFPSLIICGKDWPDILFFNYLNGYSGFFQISLHPSDQEKTMLTCPYGTFACRWMPFGLCNALATFQRCL